MKLVIDIPEEEYKECISMVFQGVYNNYNLNMAVVLYVALGKPIEESEEE